MSRRRFRLPDHPCRHRAHPARADHLPHPRRQRGAVTSCARASLMVDVTLPDDLRQVVGLLYPGDVLRSGFAPPHAAAHLSAVSAGEVLRVRWSTFTGLAAEDPEIARYFDDAVAKQTARQAIHMAAVGRFDCRQRVATFLLELALRIGDQGAMRRCRVRNAAQAHRYGRLSRAECRHPVADHVALAGDRPAQPSRAASGSRARFRSADRAHAGRAVAHGALRRTRPQATRPPGAPSSPSHSRTIPVRLRRHRNQRDRRRQDRRRERLVDFHLGAAAVLVGNMLDRDHALVLGRVEHDARLGSSGRRCGCRRPGCG